MSFNTLINNESFSQRREFSELKIVMNFLQNSDNEECTSSCSCMPSKPLTTDSQSPSFKSNSLHSNVSSALQYNEYSEHYKAAEEFLDMRNLDIVEPIPVNSKNDLHLLTLQRTDGNIVSCCNGNPSPVAMHLELTNSKLMTRRKLNRESITQIIIARDTTIQNSGFEQETLEVLKH